MEVAKVIYDNPPKTKVSSDQVYYLVYRPVATQDLPQTGEGAMPWELGAEQTPCENFLIANRCFCSPICHFERFDLDIIFSFHNSQNKLLILNLGKISLEKY